MSEDENRIKFLNRIGEFKTDYYKVILLKKKRTIKMLYMQLKREHKGKMRIGVQNSDDSVRIRVAADKFLIYDEFGTLTKLIGGCNLFTARKAGRKILFELWFRCWEWKKRSS